MSWSFMFFESFLMHSKEKGEDEDIGYTKISLNGVIGQDREAIVRKYCISKNRKGSSSNGASKSSWILDSQSFERTNFTKVYYVYIYIQHNIYNISGIVRNSQALKAAVAHFLQGE